MPDESEFELNTLQSPEQYIKLVLTYHEASGWNPTPLDWKVNRAYADYRNFLVWTYHGEHFMICSFLKDKQRRIVFWGCYAVNPKFRGLGMALPLFKTQYDRLVTRGYRVLACSVPEMTEKYISRLGMEVYGICREIEASPGDYLGLPTANLTEPLDVSDVQELAAYDQRISGSDRRRVLEVILAESSFKKWAVKKNGIIRGYAILVYGVTQPMLAPLLADTEDIAEALTTEAIKWVDHSQRLLIQGPSPSGVVKMAEFWGRLGFSATGKFDHLIGQTDFPNDLSKTFSIFNSELGL